VLAGNVVVGYEVDAFVVGANVLALAGLPGEADDVEVFVRIAIEDVVMAIVELVVAFTLAAEVMHEQTAPASTLAATAVTKPQALVAHPRALITIEFDIAGWHWDVVSRNPRIGSPKRREGGVR
jgi:hypothetical protein